MAEPVEARTLRVPAAAAGARLDRWLAEQVPGLSRSRLQALIDEGHVRVDGDVPKASRRLAGGQVITLEIPPRPPETLTPEPIELSVLYEDDDVLVVDKPVGMVVHPGAGHPTGTLAAAVLAHAPETAGVGGPRRPGIVHRLDKDTSGLLVMAKTPHAYDSLTAQLAARTVSRRYRAVVHGRVKAATGLVDAPIGRHPRDRVRMAVVPRGRRALTRYAVLERFSHFTDLDVRLETGRTHQIRVHMASLGHPVVGDALYGGRAARRPVPIDLPGLALHAAELAFVHPVTETRMEFASPLPPRIRQLLSHLRDAG
ncbi:MAG TPA: RluA family pseudouridine synthase [Methylomirabilota bacterium]|nr:RluA family pseudouridine synthase [Methylomirabilota bacterium]